MPDGYLFPLAILARLPLAAEKKGSILMSNQRVCWKILDL